MGGETSKPEGPSDGPKITIFVQSADMVKVQISIDANCKISELRNIIISTVGKRYMKIYFNKSYRDSSEFKVVDAEEIDGENTLSHYNIVEGDIVRIITSETNGVLASAVIGAAAFNGAALGGGLFNIGRGLGLVKGRIYNGDDLGKRGEDVGGGGIF